MAGTELTHYEQLGIGRDASDEEIISAYNRALSHFRRRMAKGEPASPERLDAVRLAYKTLSNPELRLVYDKESVPCTMTEAISQSPFELLKPAIANEPPSEPPESGIDKGADGSVWQFRFTGEGGEYFRIWIVNLLLSIVTLGIYSAWAKVRREQYFHRHLLLDETPFDYHGRPMAILKGRLVAFGLLLILSVSQQTGPVVYGLALLCIVPLVPWLAIRALRFRAYNTSYRGLRFSFHGQYGEAFRVFVLYGLLAMFTLWLAFPLWYRRLRTFMFGNLRYGSSQFACEVGVGQIYGAILGPVLMVVGLLLMLGFGAGLLGTGLFGGGMSKTALAALGGVAVIVFITFQISIVPWVRARLTNVVWNAIRLEQHRFQSTLKVRRYIGLTLVNWLATLLTLGLFFPWARIRMARYRAECLLIDGSCELGAFVAGEQQYVSALGDETAEMFDMDVAI